MRSKVLSTDVEMKVWVPDSFELASAEHTYPVIFINGEHGNQFFTAVVGVVKHLGDRERMPESIVVSLTDMGDIPEIFTHGMWSRETPLGMGYAEDETFIDTLEAMWSKHPARQMSLYVGVAESDQDRREYRDNMKQLAARLGRFEGLSVKAGLADAYDAAGRPAEAVAAQRNALKMAKARVGDGVGKQDIERLKERLAELQGHLKS